MTTSVRLALTVAGSGALYKLGAPGAPFSGFYYNTPFTAIAALAVVLFLALGVFDAARDWNLGWRRIAVIGAAVLTVAALLNWFSQGWWLVDAVWRVALFLAVPAAALTAWSWFRWGPAGGNADARFTLGTVAGALTPYRIPVALVFGAVVPLALFTGSRPGLWTEPTNALLALGLAAAATAVLIVLPKALGSVAGMVPGRRRSLLLGIGVLAAAFAVYVGVNIESSSNPGLVDAGVVVWYSVMAPALLVTLVHLVSRVGVWAGEGFAVADAAEPPGAPDEGRTRADEPAGAVVRRRAARARKR